MGFYIGHLHKGERDRIRGGDLNPHEREAVAKGEDPWEKLRKPLPPDLLPPPPTLKSVVDEFHQHTAKQISEEVGVTLLRAAGYDVPPRDDGSSDKVTPVELGPASNEIREDGYSNADVRDYFDRKLLPRDSHIRIANDEDVAATKKIQENLDKHQRDRSFIETIDNHQEVVGQNVGPQRAVTPPDASSVPWHNKAEIVIGVILALLGLAVAIGLVILPPTSARAIIPWLCLMLGFLLLATWLLARFCNFSRSRSVISFCVPVAFVVVFGWYAWPEPKDPQSTKIRVAQGETVTARIKAWGTSGEHDIFAIVNSIELTPLADDYKLAIVCRVQDNKIDGKTDLRIDKSGQYSITGNEQRLEVALSQDTMRRIIPNQWVNIYILLVPSKINPKEMHSVNEFTQNGAHLVGNPSLMVHAATDTKSGTIIGK